MAASIEAAGDSLRTGKPVELFKGAFHADLHDDAMNPCQHRHDG